jgi:hypothetical protein
MNLKQKAFMHTIGTIALYVAISFGIFLSFQYFEAEIVIRALMVLFLLCFVKFIYDIKISELEHKERMKEFENAK